MKIVILDGVSLNPGDLSWEGLEKHGEVTVYEFTHPHEVMERIDGAEIVYTNKTRLTGDMIRSAKDLRFIGVMATGFDVVDIEAARKRGIPVSNAPGYSTPAVAQLAMALMLETAMQVGEYNRDVHAGKWINTPNHQVWSRPLVELAGKTLGIYGCGNIGRQVAKMAQGFGMDIIAYSRRARPGTVREGITFVSKEELFARSQYLSLNSPLNSDSRHIVNRD
ncbi:MAG: D-2-hydroxyacid dehydrogenase, partial [Ruminococcaceae bacterium]|nr:D-2-hydroxyacid dehydrogenase [Oscillospiraceae bacterium]